VTPLLTPRRWRAATALTLLVSIAAAGCSSSGNDTATTTAALAPKLIADGRLTVCTSLPYEPFEFKSKGETVGFDIDLAKQLAKRLDLKPIILNTDFDAIQSGELLNNGKCDVAAAGMTITGERARVLDFSSPYFDAAQAMVVKRTSPVHSLSDLHGEKIAVQKGTTGEIYVTDHAPRDAEVVTFKTAGDVDAALENDEVAAGVYDNTVVGDVVSRHPGFKVAGEFDTGEQYGMVVKKNSNIDLLRAINDMLADLKADGGYKSIYKKWFGGSSAG
jgi:polar amino acid transport system substrate-binding protein